LIHRIAGKPVFNALVTISQTIKGEIGLRRTFIPTIPGTDTYADEL
jgi:hypothetical protein